ncbi:MAG: preprotein translocase subunit SecG [Candidatus Omnitrophota bacterium]
MYAIIIFIHVIACLILIASILLQTGKGGGISELFGGGSSQTLFGTRASTFLVRATTSAAIVFLLTCLSLTILSSQRVQSLMSGVKPVSVTETPAIPVPIETIPAGVEEAQPAQQSEAQPAATQE